MFRFLVSKLLLFFMRFSMFQDSSGQKNPQKNLVSGNAGYKDNLYVGCGKFIFFNQFSGDIFFSSLVSFVFFVFLLLLFFLLVWILKLTICILMHIRLCGWVSDRKFFHPIDFRNQNKTTFFWSDYLYYVYIICIIFPIFWRISDNFNFQQVLLYFPLTDILTSQK